MTEEPPALRAAIRRLDGDAFAAFVADLWRERGWRVERDERTVRATRDDERRTLFAVPATRRARWLGSVPERADAVCAAADESAAVDGSELVSMLRYAIPPEAAERLCERHLGASPSELALPMGVRVRRALGGLPLRRASAAAVLLVAATALAAAGATGGPFAALASGPSDDANGTGDTEPTTDPEILTRGDNMPVVNLSDVFSPDELVSDHRAAIADRPYRLHITRVREANLSDRPFVIRETELFPGDPDGEDGDSSDRPLVVRETVKQVGDRYIHRLRPENDAGTIFAQDIYSNGSASFVADYRNADSPYRYERFETMPAGPREWATRRLGTYLNATDVSVEPRNGSEAGFRITGDGAPPGMNASVYHFSAVRSETGLITKLRVEYARGNRTGYVTWTYSSMVDASIDPPAWYDRKFGNGTENDTTDAPAV